MDNTCFFFVFFLTYFIDEVIRALFSHRFVDHVQSARGFRGRLHAKFEFGQPFRHLLAKLHGRNRIVGVRDGLLGPVWHRLLDLFRREMIRGRDLHAKALSQAYSNRQSVLEYQILFEISTQISRSNESGFFFFFFFLLPASKRQSGDPTSSLPVPYGTSPRSTPRGRAPSNPGRV